MWRMSSDKTLPLYQRISEGVRQALLTGKLMPGQKLPPRPVLAHKLGVQTAPVRDAFRQLEQENLVTSRRGDGTYIRMDALDNLHRKSQRQINHLVVMGMGPHLHSHRGSAFIDMDILAGVRDVLGNWELRISFIESLDKASADRLGPDSALLIRMWRDLDQSLIHQLASRGLPMVSVWGQVQYRMPHVTVDRSHGAALACQHLVDLGHQRIGYMGRLSHESGMVESKFAAFGRTLQSAGLDMHARYVREVHGQPGQAYQAMQKLIKKRDLPQAIFVDTDYKAMEVLTALQHAGLRVPQDIAIVGYDGIPEAATFTPALTTVAVPRREVGRQAARLLLDWPATADAQTLMPADIVLQSQLVVRTTTNAAYTPENQVVHLKESL